jgi:hypothetical protein
MLVRVGYEDESCGIDFYWFSVFIKGYQVKRKAESRWIMIMIL